MGVQDPARRTRRATAARRSACSRRGRRHRVARAASASASGVVGAARDERGVDPLLGRPVERRAGPVGEDEHDLAAELAARAPPRGAPGGCEPGAGHADRDPRSAAHAIAHGRAAPRRSAARRRPGTTSPTTVAGDPLLRRGASIVAGDRLGRDDRDHPEPAVERRSELDVVEAAERPDQPHDRRHRASAPGRAGRRGPAGRARGTLPGSPPPVMWARPRRSWPAAPQRGPQPRGRAGRRSASASAGPRRASPGACSGSARDRARRGLASPRRQRCSCSWYGRARSRSHFGEQRADEREAVGVEPARRRGRRSRRRPGRPCRRAVRSRSTTPTQQPGEVERRPAP